MLVCGERKARTEKEILTLRVNFKTQPSHNNRYNHPLTMNCSYQTLGPYKIVIITFVPFLLSFSMILLKELVSIQNTELENWWGLLRVQFCYGDAGGKDHSLERELGGSELWIKSKLKEETPGFRWVTVRREVGLTMQAEGSYSGQFEKIVETF